MSFRVYEAKLLAKLIAIYFHVLNHFGKNGLIDYTNFIANNHNTRTVH